MSKSSIFFSTLFLFLLPLCLHAQNKYAVLVGINDYYEQPGVRHRQSLSGCVNDAEAVRQLLINRFGFEATNIERLYNSAATKKNLIDALLQILKRCKPGDAVVFYYSGHGVWMTNHELDDNPVKRGMSQAIVMSDLYSPGWGCLVRDETLKSIFNNFVDKKIIVTTIYDCCFGGSLMKLPKTKYWMANPYSVPSVKKSFSIGSIPYIPVRSDRRDSMSVVEDAENFMNSPDDYYDPVKFGADSTEMKAYNLSDALTVSNKSAPGPFEKTNSQFLTISGTQDNQKGLESVDISGVKHGVFTSALLQVYRSNPATLPLFELMNQVKTIMGQQAYKQLPSFYYDPSRMNKNLLGINPSGFQEKLKAVCISDRNGSVVIDKGYLAGVTRGNIFSAIPSISKKKIRITKVYPDSAIGVAAPGNPINTGQAFELINDHTISEPFIKLYIHSGNFTQTTFDNFFKKKIEPVIKQADYGDYNFCDEMRNVNIIYWKDAVTPVKIQNAFYPGMSNALLYVIPPIPSFVAGEIRAFLLKDQNIEIVNDPGKADYGIYMNFAKPRDGNAGEFVFYIHPVINDTAKFISNIFSAKHISVLTLDQKNILKIKQELYTHARDLIRVRTSAWMNTYQRR